MRDPKQKRVLLRGILILAVAVAVIAVVMILISDDEKQPEVQTVMTEGFGQLKTVTVDGVTYKQKPAVTTILLYGVDKESAPVTDENKPVNYRDGGQSDFLLLLAINHTNREIYQLHIDRDTMTPIQILGVFGNEVGTRNLQICLAHYFGATPQDNARYTVKAVQNLLGGLDITGYYGINLNAVPVLNDLLGGVWVTIPDDMTDIYPEWTPGTRVFLKGKDSEYFVRTRMTVGDGTNASRAIRQRAYMSSAIGNMKQKLSSSASFAMTLMNTMEPLATTNLSTARMINEINQAANYKIYDPDTLPGEYSLGKEGFVEFHAVENSGVQWVLDHLYQKQ